MAKYGGTLVANTNTPVATADGNRMAVAIQNLDAASAIKVEFGAAADTAAGSSSWHLAPSGSLVLARKDFPEIALSINLKSTGTPAYVVRDHTI
ncbi:MAG: hypothetical protein JSS81_07490 [Acidobacteria bacterium]|nr:hypothetical protein [Acidobacteriota bacterium]